MSSNINPNMQNALPPAINGPSAAQIAAAGLVVSPGLILDWQTFNAFLYRGSAQAIELARFPIRRNLLFRPGANSSLVAQHGHRTYMEAAMAFAVGDVTANACAYCERGNGPFVLCVSVTEPRENVDHGFYLNGSCVNCHYGRTGGCTFRLWMQEEDENETIRDQLRDQGFRF